MATQQKQGQASYTPPWGSLEQQKGYAEIGGGGNPLNVVKGTGYGLVPDVVMKNPYAAALMGQGSEAAWGDFVRGFPTGNAERLRAMGYSSALGDAAYDRDRAIRRGMEADVYARKQLENERMFQGMILRALSGQGGGLPGGFNLDDLIAKATAPMLRAQTLENQQAGENWGSLGRNVGGNTAFQNVMAQLGSRHQEALGATSADVVLRALAPMLNAQQQQFTNLMSLYQAPNAFLQKYYGG